MSNYFEAAKQAIDRLFGDTSVDQKVTLEHLEELRDDIEMKIESLQYALTL